MSKKGNLDESVSASNYVVSGNHEEGELLELPSNATKIRLETDNSNLFYRASGSFKDPDTELVLAAPGCQMIIIKDGVSSGLLNNGSYRAFEEKDIIAKKSLFNRKGKVKEGILFDVIVFNTKLSYEAFWGTPTPIPYRDPETGIPVEIKGRGKYDIRISDIDKFYNTLVGSNRTFTMDDLLDRINIIVIQILRNELAKVVHQHHLGYIDLALHEAEIAEEIQPMVSLTLNEQYGLYVPLFTVTEFFVDEDKRKEIEAAIKAERDVQKFKADAQELAAQLGKLDKDDWERTKFLTSLRSQNEQKYLEVLKIEEENANKEEEPVVETAVAPKKVCPKCNSEFDSNIAFCPNCGTKLVEKVLEKRCPHCGEVIETEGKFCPFCGKEL